MILAFHNFFSLLLEGAEEQNSAITFNFATKPRRFIKLALTSQLNLHNMFRHIAAIILLLCAGMAMTLHARNIVVADSLTHTPLPNATVSDCRGEAFGITSQRGVLPAVPKNRLPITISYLGFNEKTVNSLDRDTIFLTESFAELPEVVAMTRRQRVLHVLAYVREYSTLSTYTDTVFLFREKMVDFMFPSDPKVKFNGWPTPRMLTSKSYYRFTNSNGLDSVSDVSNNHFSWSDWIGLRPRLDLPQPLISAEHAVDTIHGKYSPTEIWRRDNDSVTVNIDVLADKTSRKWVRNLEGFFRGNLEFEKFDISYNYNNVTGDSVTAMDLDGYTFNIESAGRGHDMFRFNRVDEPFFVSTRAEVYVIGKEYITVKEARKWEKMRLNTDEIGIYEAMDAPQLDENTLNLIARVNALDTDDVRLNIIPDQRLVSLSDSRKNFRMGTRALIILKNLTGITSYKFHKNTRDTWSKFRRVQQGRNNSRPLPE